MNSTSHNSISGRAPQVSSSSAEDTLRLIARLPAPEGIEGRVNAGLKSAPRGGRILHWPQAFQPAGSWMRGAAAAAIVFVVAGGGWGVYTRVQPTQPAKVIAMPRAGAGGGFSSAGAMRTPQTLNGPVVAEPVTGLTGNAQPGDLLPAQTRPGKKIPTKVVPMTNGPSKAGVGNSSKAQTAAAQTAAKAR